MGNRHEPPPQTPEEALAMGWAVMRACCLRCGRMADRRIDSFAIAQARVPLARIVAKMRCSECSSRRIKIALLSYAPGSGEAGFAVRKWIRFAGDIALAPRRDEAEPIG